MKLNTQLKLLSIMEDRCKELETENRHLKCLISDGNTAGIVYIPFPEKKGLLGLIANWFKVRPLETTTLIHSHWISMMIDGEPNKHVCANCFSIFKEDAKEFAYCPMCAAMMDRPCEKGDKNDQL